MLDHASVSRQHAILCYQTNSNKWVIVDQGSAHGTSVNGKPTVKVKMLLEVARNIICSQDNCPAVVSAVTQRPQQHKYAAHGHVSPT